MAFRPASLEVAPGAVVTVRNLDGMAHSVTSQASPGAFVAGGVAGVSFDTGPFISTATFTIPASAAVGTVIPFYCSTHLGLMTTPNGEIRVAATSTPAPQTTPDPPDPGTY
jgi:plastocyanin